MMRTLTEASFDVVVVAEAAGDFLPEGRAGFAGGVDGADDGQDDVAVGVNEVAFLGAVAVVESGVAHFRDGEGGYEFGLLAADGDGEFVVFLDGCLVVLQLLGRDAV